ncbi:NADH-quinone oxidoreductase subunit B family protein [Oecophyllibacter saccharovorans]|uniref:NADH-quinone oxidoreductase subunit B family protein n=1 Tax=Oecophyllibacter saccharovorans TaxID=2558360 RepID=UPI001E626557|nr:hypothetical protein [Oecophyllibacter saccharovorans]
MDEQIEGQSGGKDYQPAADPIMSAPLKAKESPAAARQMQSASVPVTLLMAFLDAQRWRPRARHGRLRQLIRLYPVATGGCDGCAMEVQMLPSVTALEGSGFQLVDDPALADWLLLSGPVTRASAGRLAEVWSRMPPGRCMIALGACALNGGVFPNDYAVLGGVSSLARSWRTVPGCPPAPEEILQALCAFAREGERAAKAQARR